AGGAARQPHGGVTRQDRLEGADGRRSIAATETRDRSPPPDRHGVVAKLARRRFQSGRGDGGAARRCARRIPGARNRASRLRDHATGATPLGMKSGSSCEARRNRVVSSPNRATHCTPIGKPSRLLPSGSDIAGWPLALNSGVNGPYVKAALFEAAMSPPSVRSTPSFTGGRARVGVITTSWLRQARAVCRTQRLSRASAPCISTASVLR